MRPANTDRTPIAPVHARFGSAGSLSAAKISNMPFTTQKMPSSTASTSTVRSACRMAHTPTISESRPMTAYRTRIPAPLTGSLNAITNRNDAGYHQLDAEHHGDHQQRLRWPHEHRDPGGQRQQPECQHPAPAVAHQGDHGVAHVVVGSHCLPPDPGM